MWLAESKVHGGEQGAQSRQGWGKCCKCQQRQGPCLLALPGRRTGKAGIPGCQALH